MNSYEDFKNNYKQEKLPSLAFFKPEYPYGEFVVIDKDIISNKPDALKLFCEKEKMNISILNGNYIVSTQQLQTDKDGSVYLFSGIARWKEKLVFGNDDIKKYNIPVRDLNECLGTFELLIFGGNKLEISTDYFGMCQLFYYKKDDKNAVISTSYHLLLMILKLIGCNLSLNSKRTAAGMFSFHPFSQQCFTEEMDVNVCFMLPAYKRLNNLIGKSGFLSENTSLYNEIYEPEEYSEEKYEKYLFQTKDEIIENLRAVFESEHFDNILCDLSGGFDSRIVLAAALNLPHSLTNKLRIYSKPELEDDFKIANAIVNTFGLNWDDIPVEVSCNNISLTEDEINIPVLSYRLGTYYIDDINSLDDIYKKTINIFGGCEDFKDKADHFFPRWDFKQDEKEIVNSPHFCTRNKLDIDINGKTAINFNKLLRTNISNMPGIALKEKIDLFYIKFRNRLHYKSKYKNMTAWAPMQSKTAFHCKRMYFRNKKIDNKFQYDFIKLLNPLLANFPYDDKNNIRVNKFTDNECLYRTGFPNVNITPNFDTSEYYKTKKDIEYVPDKKTADDCAVKLQEWYSSKSVYLNALKTILDYSDEFDEVGLPLYQYFTDSGNSDKYQYVHADKLIKNRLLSAYYQIQIIK